MHEPDPGPPEVDAYSADRFTVDLDEYDDASWAKAVGSPAPEVQRRITPWRLVGRLVLVVVVTLLAFHHSVESLLRAVESGSLLAYVLAVPLLAGLACVATNRRPTARVASRVRLADALLGASICLVALGVDTLLGPGLSGVYQLWRLDLLMLWLFLLGASVLCFGRPQVVWSWPYWVVLLLVWPFPVRMANAAVGGAVGGAMLLSLVVLGVIAYGHRTADPPRWLVLSSSAAAGGVVLALVGLTTHPQRLLWPSVVVTGVAVVWWARHREAESDAPLFEHRVPGTGPVLVGLALLGFVALPAAPRIVPPSAPTGITALSLGGMVVPGFTTTATSELEGQQHYFGKTSTWERFSLRQGESGGEPALGGRDLVVDVLSTPRPQVLALYPVVTTYPMGTMSATPEAVADLGHGVAGQVFRGEDPRRNLAYTLLTFSWELPVDMSIVGGYRGPSAQLNQRFTLIVMDDQRPGAAFPEPGNATLDGIRTAVTSGVGEQRVREGSGPRSDEQLLDDTARALVHKRLTGG